MAKNAGDSPHSRVHEAVDRLVADGGEADLQVAVIHRGELVVDPLTMVDARFSDPDAEPTSWQATQEVLENAQITWLTAVRVACHVPRRP